MKAWQRLMPEPTSGFECAFLLGADYNSDKNVCRLKFYDSKNKRIYEYFDDTNHKPYLLTNMAPEFIKPLQELESVIRIERVKKYDSILDMEREMTKVVATDPLAVGGESHMALKNVIPTLHPNADTWEDEIRYHHCYLYDRQLYCGMPYKLKDDELSLVTNSIGKTDSVGENRIEELVRTVREKFNNMNEKHVRAWAKLLEAPSLDFHRIVLDIEVLSPSPEHIPNPHEALYSVICVGFQTSDDKRFMFMLRRNGIEMGDEEVDGTIIFFDDERELVKAVFDLLWRYPFVVTFNGDEFDLLYLYCRSFKLHIPRNQVPIVLKKKDCNMKYGFHIDLCKFFSNRSLQTYAFQKKYVDFGLDDIGKGLLGLGKLKAEGEFNEISYTALAKYCFRDVEITYNLTDFDDEKVLKLMLAVTRISRLPLEDVIRSSVSKWIRGFIEFEHRKANVLLPRRDDLLAKGEIQTGALSKDKKFRGAIILKPKSGVHFDVDVVDFGSLYPSIVKEHNLGYEAVNCNHDSCKENPILIPDTSHYICKENRSLVSNLIGSLKDIRIAWYKPKSKVEKDKHLKSWYGCIEGAIKQILNAGYGVFGREQFTFYCPPIAEGVTAFGRQTITKTMEKAKSMGIEVLYGDTDSIFMKKLDVSQLKQLIEWTKEKLLMDFELDKKFRYVIFSERKKNYIGVLDDGTLEIKGLSGKKKHTPLIIRGSFDIVKKHLSKVKTEEEFEAVRKSTREVYKMLYLRLKRREWDSLDELAFHMVLSKNPDRYIKSTPQHVKAALQLQEEGWEIGKGDVVHFIKVKGDPNVKPLSLAKSEDVDVEKYIEMLDAVFAQITEPMNISLDKVKGFTRMTDYMPKPLNREGSS